MRGIIIKLGFGAVVIIIIGVGFLAGQEARHEEQGFPTDWSHRHVVFSRPANAQQAARVEGDARYWQQFARGHIARKVMDDLSDEREPEREGRWKRKRFPASVASTRIRRDWSENMGSGAGAGADVYPAKFTFQTSTASCATDFVVYNTGLMGSGSQASIVAYRNLYVGGCSGAVPQTYWAYNTGGQILTAPVISFDGTQVAFVQTTGTAATVVLLKWAALGTVGSPATAPTVGNAQYRTCTAPCKTTIDLLTGGASGTAVDDQTSSAFPDYNKDVLWIGSTSGYLHKITGVFKGTPGLGANFPKQLNPGNPKTLSGPVYDFASNNVYVGDYGGFLYQVNATSGAVVTSGRLEHLTGLVAAPIVDSTAGKIYVFASNDGSTACLQGASPCSAVWVMNIASFVSGYRGTKVIVGVSSATTTVPLYEGDFDSTYYNSSNGTGNLYVCGNTDGSPILYQIPLTAGVPGTVAPGPPLTTGATSCSPLTDVYNPSASTEWIFASVQAIGSGTNCAAGGCVMNFVNTPRIANHAYSAGQLVIDNHFQVQVVMTAGTSGAATPTWSTTPAANTTDGTVTWIDQGPYSPNIAPWQPDHFYSTNAQALDGNGAVVVNVKIGNTKSNPTPPTWSTGIGSSTTETGGGPHWVNVGSPATNSLAAAGGTSGISIDNTVGSGTLAGASQVYFSTLANQNCPTSGGTGGCAVQASQAGLK